MILEPTRQSAPGKPVPVNLGTPANGLQFLEITGLAA